MQKLSLKNFAIILFFLIIIWLPLSAMILKIEERYLNENRNKTEWPDVKSLPIIELPTKLTEYFNDNFGLRDRLIAANSYIRFEIFGFYNSEKAIIGRNNWLFYRPEQIDDFLGEKPFTNAQLEAWQNDLERKKNLLNKQGIEYLFIVAPNKTSIYPEYLPSHLQEKSKKTRLHQLTEHLAENSPIRILDLRYRLREEKGNKLIYHSNDTHWNDWGGYYAYQEIMLALQQWFPELIPLRIDDFTISTRITGGDLIPMLGLGGKLSKRFLAKTDIFSIVKPSSTDAALELPSDHDWPVWADWNKPIAYESSKNNLKLLVLHDSFIDHGPKKKLAEHFQRSVFIHCEPNLKLLKQLIDQEKPDIVIEERVERSLANVPQG